MQLTLRLGVCDANVENYWTAEGNCPQLHNCLPVVSWSA
jgi:hypothetical protein